MKINLADLIKEYSEPYRRHFSGQPSDIREYIAIIDFYTKIITTILVAHSVKLTNRIKIGSTPGLGQMLSKINDALKWKENDPITQEWIQFSRLFLTNFRKQIHKDDKFTNIRNKYSHGQALPANELEAQDLLAATKTLFEDIYDTVINQFKHFDVTIQDKIVSIEKARYSLQLSPLWIFNPGTNTVGFYSCLDEHTICYMCPTAGTTLEDDQSWVSNFKNNFLSDSLIYQFFGRFIKNITDDIVDFSEDHSASHFFGEEDDTGSLIVTWIFPQLDSSETRIDRFQIRDSNQYSWFDRNKEEWRPYNSFLKKISHWQMVAKRIKNGLQRQKKIISLNDSNQSQLQQFPPMPTSLSKEGDSRDTPYSLIENIDDSAKQLKQCTSVYFLTGEAGIGKTEYLLNQSLARAEEIEANPDTSSPLFLYISSLGKALSNLEDVVSNALVQTMLTNESAKALCRNGLLVLIVDGFDELLGTPNYDDPRSSLATWFRDLKGRGVIVASARSNYYIIQFRKSSSEIANHGTKEITVSVNPWTQDTISSYFLRNGIKQNQLTPLTSRDWALLSVPFFAKSYVSWFKSNSSTRHETKSIFQIVVDLYIDRELSKLTDNSGSSIIENSELQRFYSELADMMHREGVRLLENSDIKLCASMVKAKNEEAFMRRLSSLCGLAANELLEGSLKFYFSHEAIFDSFLSLSISKQCTEGQFSTISTLFERGEIRSAVMEWFVNNLSEEALNLLNHLLVSAKERPVWKKNVGTLWVALLDYNNGTPPTPLTTGLVFEVIKLQAEGDIPIRLLNCQIEELYLPSIPISIDLADSNVKYLNVNNPSLLRKVINIKPENILEIRLSTGHHDSTSQIRKILEEAGVINKEPDSLTLQWHDSINFFLKRIINKPDVLIIDETTFETDSPGLNWTSRFGIYQWKKFIQALKDNNLIDLETIAAKGTRKLKIAFKIPESTIANKDFNYSGVENFWNGS